MCVWLMFVVYMYTCCSDYVWVCGNVCCVAGIVEDGGFQPWSVVCLCRGCDGCFLLDF